MKAGSFNINSYLDKLYESAEDGNLTDKEGLIIPEENKKTYNWLKKEYHQAQTEVKVEISGEGSSFKPGYDLQTNLDSVKDFKPGMFGEIRTADNDKKVPSANVGEKTKDDKVPLDAKKGNPNFGKDEGKDKTKPTDSKTNGEKDDINNKETDDKKPEVKVADNKKPEVKKIDLKTKKK